MILILTLCPPRCLTTQVNCADLPAATVIFSSGEMKPGSKPVTENKDRRGCDNQILCLKPGKVLD